MELHRADEAELEAKYQHDDQLEQFADEKEITEMEKRLVLHIPIEASQETQRELMLHKNVCPQENPARMNASRKHCHATRSNTLRIDATLQTVRQS